MRQHFDTTASPFDLERLRAIASDNIVRRGIAYFRENRVIDLGWDAERIWASVEGSNPGLPYEVAITLDQDAEVLVDCDCPFDWEPVCKHAVATLLAYESHRPAESITVEGAADRAVEERAKRGRSEVVVEPLRTEGPFGTWAARSLRRYRPTASTYRVQIRSLDERVNYCTCPDFAGNQLGTCKHIEAVLHRVRKGGAATSSDAGAAPLAPAFVALDWETPRPPAIRLVHGERLDAEVRAALAPLFDGDGRLHGELPGAYHRLVEAVAGHAHPLIGEDVAERVRRITEQQAAELRGQRIAREIRASGRRIPGVDARLFDYQIDGVAFLASAGRGVLADDMGLGKTLQAIAAATWLHTHDRVERTLIVCPASLKHQWAREITRFVGLPSTIVQGPAAERAALYRRHTPFTIVNYELVLRDLSVIAESLSPDLLILDEAQRIKNWRTKTADAVKAIDTPFAFVLTGTPLENRLHDLYSLMQVVDGDILGPLWRFDAEFHVLDERGTPIGYRNLTELRRRLEPKLLRRDRRLVREQLPERLEQRIELPLDPKQYELHHAALSAAGSLAQISKRRPLTPSEENRLMAALQSARMACDAAGLVDKETEGSPKLEELGRIIEETCLETGRKAVVFSQWERMTEMAEAVIRSLGVGTIRLHGGVPTARRGALLDRFSDDPTVQVLLSTDAGGVGLNLQHADLLINLDMPWNPAVLDQRIARVHRLGQRRAVQIVLLLAADSYESHVAGLVEAKRDLFVNAVTEDATEDVVGITKLAFEALDETLGGGAQPASGADEPEPEPEDTDAAALPDGADDRDGAGGLPHIGSGASVGPLTDAELAAVITSLQLALGARIERVVVGRAGLLIVVDVRDAEALRSVAFVSREHGDVPIECIDAATYAALTRVGLGNQFGRVVAERQARSGVPEVPKLLSLSRRKLEAAERLLAGDCVAESLTLLAASLVALAAHRAGLEQAPGAEHAAVWLHTAAVPAGWVSPDELSAALSAQALSAAPAVPAAVAERLFEVARVALSGASGPA
jgi:superfamily II DNA or RNA helicase